MTDTLRHCLIVAVFLPTVFATLPFADTEIAYLMVKTDACWVHLVVGCMSIENFVIEWWGLQVEDIDCVY